MRMSLRHDGRFTAGEYAGKYVVAEADEAGSMIALICDGVPGELKTIADFWFEDVDDMESGLNEGDWAVEWLSPGTLGTPS